VTTILVVDDDSEIADLVEIYLLAEGFRVCKATDGAAALECVRRETPDLIVLDVMMPGTDGIEVCRQVRAERDTPILMLSARSETPDKVLGLGIGADDYVSKPFNPLELIARVKALLRRYRSLGGPAGSVDSAGDDLIAVRGLEISRSRHTVTVDGSPVSLTPTEFQIVELLAANPGRVFSSEEIFERVWREPYLQGSNTVMVHIRKIREKIEDDPRHPVLIQTVWGVGYKIDR
jgi:DNA-binding response OmpR family regulator